MKKYIALFLMLLMFTLCACGKQAKEVTTEKAEPKTAVTEITSQEVPKTTSQTEAVSTEAAKVKEEISWNSSWQYADYSQIHSSSVTLYYADASVKKNITVCVNAGHGTKGGSAVKTYCHPDKTPKVTGGSTAKGATMATSVSEGMTFPDGTPEAKANLSLALLVKEKLLAAGYNVLMIREENDVQLDNIARTVFANNNADCHIALHYDSTETDKGLFYMSVPNVTSYRSMEPVASHYKEHTALGEALIQGERSKGVKIYSGGQMPVDLTQTSYSTVPSIDLEVGDKGSDYSEKTQALIADGILAGLNIYFNQ